MRILVISCLYPPYYRGGYEIMCKLVNEKLIQRGHTIRVLTSDFKSNKKKIEGEVYRIFGYNFGGKTSFWKNLILEVRNNRILKRQIRKFKPDIISIWHFVFLSRALLARLDSFEIPVVYNLEDHWLISWYYASKHEDWFSYFDFGNNRLKNILKFSIKNFLSFLVPTKWKSLNLTNIWFVSNSLKKQYLEAGLPVSSGEVIYNGLELEKFPLVPKERDKNILRLLWVGRIAEYKGTHTAIEAMSILVNKLGIRNVRLSIVGEADNDKYLSFLKHLIKKNNLSDRITFESKLPRDKIVKKYLESDIFLFTSIYKEPFGLTWLEAFACGIPVVGTVTGASKEIFIDGENALVYKAGEDESLALGVKRLIEDEHLYKKIQINAIEIVKQKFNIKDMVDKVEKLYQDALQKQSN